MYWMMSALSKCSGLVTRDIGVKPARFWCCRTLFLPPSNPPPFPYTRTNASLSYLGQVTHFYLGQVTHSYLGQVTHSYLGPATHSYLGQVTHFYLGQVTHSYLGQVTHSYLGQVTHSYLGQVTFLEGLPVHFFYWQMYYNASDLHVKISASLSLTEFFKTA